MRLNGNKMTRRPNGAHRTSAFTLVEMLVTILIVSLLVALLIPALAKSLATARGLRCKLSQRSVAFDFVQFADDGISVDRGDDTGRGNFSIDTFIESQLQIDEFWNREGLTFQTPTSDREGLDPMRCPEVSGPVMYARGRSCTENGIVGPWENISYAFNIRLRQREVLINRGNSLHAQRLDSSILSEPGQIPLLWDVDGDASLAADKFPLFGGPAFESREWSRDRVWHPALRHGGTMNVAFVDGHVDSTTQPLAEQWRWQFAR